VSAASHTPGPWRLAGRLGYGWLVDPNIAVAYGGAGSGREGDGPSNARLIAAAPDMLLALKAMTEEWVDYMTTNNIPGDPWAKHNMRLAKLAIEKAEGRLS
jgi:hypothetical protein